MPGDHPRTMKIQWVTDTVTLFLSYWIRTRPVEDVSVIVFEPPLLFAKVMFPIEAVELGLKLALSPGKVMPLITIPEGNSWETPWLIQFPPVS